MPQGIPIPVSSCIGGSKPGQSICLQLLTTAPAHLKQCLCVCVQHHSSGIISCYLAVSITARISGYALSTHHATVITLSYAATSSPALHTSQGILQQHRELCFMELLSCWCKACSLCGLGCAHTEGAEQA